MDTGALKKFAQQARRSLMGQVRSRIDFILSGDTALHREHAKTIETLRQEISTSSVESVVERVAYLWFNRFVALRYMDVNNYTFIGILTPKDNHTHPEILQEAKEGNISKELEHYIKLKVIEDIQSGRTPSQNPQQDVYRLLLVATCNYYHSLMPFIFEEIADYTELLMPEDLLSDASILKEVRSVLTEDTCRDVEVIGWLYQFYISEKKDQVFDDLKKNIKINTENIPAATQLFTPHWIVRYLVENSLGRLWMLNHPGSSLKADMEYYIEPVDEEKDYLKVESPEELKICDPACGSGHMLTYTFDLLYKIYEEEGYNQKDIPTLILKNNLYGIEIDERAGELAAFALYMKAVEKDKLFFERKLQPNICVLENITFEKGELNQYMDEVGGNLFTMPLQNTLSQFEEAKNFGSLIRPEVTDVQDVITILEEKEMGSNLLLHHIHKNVLRVLHQVEYLSSRYHVVIANPPYMGAKGMTERLKSWAQTSYPISKYDLFSMFIERNLQLTMQKGLVSMITMQSWLFLSTYENLRLFILKEGAIASMAHLGPRAFDSIGGEVVSTSAFIIQKDASNEYLGIFLDIRKGINEREKRELLIIKSEQTIFHARSIDFHKMPCSPIAYWVNEQILNSFSNNKSVSDVALPKQGLSTCNNDLFLRQWHEVPIAHIGFGYKNRNIAASSDLKWFPYNKGGSFRKWYGNNEYILNWKNDGKDVHQYNNVPMDYNGAPVRGKNYYFKEGMTWSSLAGIFSGRLSPQGFAFDAKGPVLFSTDEKYNIEVLMGYLNSRVALMFLEILAPTLDFNQGPIGRMPLPNNSPDLGNIIKILVGLSKQDWDSYETSWDFTTIPILQDNHNHKILKDSIDKFRSNQWEMTLKMQNLEKENNRIFIEAYCLQDKFTPDVPLEQITLSGNPYYNYGVGKNEDEYELLFKIDTINELISYAVGCMFGRYSLDKPGLVLANAGETLKDYLKQIPNPTFTPDKDNVIPLLDGEWFNDDVTERFRQFLKVTFGEEHYDENLAFIEDAIGKDIRSYFVKDFYNDHVKRYKKRPIYWLFSSPKGSFNAMIYLHRYRPDTVSIVLNEYLREFRTKLTSTKVNLEHLQVSANSSQSEKTKALKEIDKIKKIIDEVDEYERDILYPLAMQKIEIDLDDGVKVNYNKFGKALKVIKGMDE
jgi:type II restriction/modification system DNA methylase subunit YeeA